ncbi:MAG: anaerobic ribonucleoside-triphosphate reductase, partial [Clostridia bacterium]|nr:anaerobic ribonucleoside-triphosphate reductase [Clostridia bacterium]
MKVIKRNGQVVDFDREKIKIAIEKANKEVRPKQRATMDEIKEIIKYIAESDKKRMLVEDIQDIIEQKLMEIGRYELAKRYIVYRYTRALVRKQNTTDETILGLLRNANQGFDYKNQTENTSITAVEQRNYIASEVSKDLTKRMLLPEKISKAHEEGILYFHNSEYFIQPIINSSFINIGDMLDNGTVICGKMIETPKTFQVACIVVAQIIAAVSCNQYGEQAVDLTHLGRYLRRSYEKYKNEIKSNYGEKIKSEIVEELVQRRVKEELKSGIQSLQYQLNTLITTKGNIPDVTLVLHLETEDEYLNENKQIVKEILEQRYNGIKNEEGVFTIPSFPKIIYVKDEEIKVNSKEFEKLKEIIEKSKIQVINKKMEEDYEGKFDQGKVSINLAQIGIIADGNEKEFWNLLDERLEICKEALMCRHYALLGTNSDVSPIHWQYGAISRLQKGEKIDKLLYGYCSTITLGYVGIEQVTKLGKGVSI